MRRRRASRSGAPCRNGTRSAAPTRTPAPGAIRWRSRHGRSAARTGRSALLQLILVAPAEFLRLLALPRLGSLPGSLLALSPAALLGFLALARGLGDLGLGGGRRRGAHVARDRPGIAQPSLEV